MPEAPQFEARQTPDTIRKGTTTTYNFSDMEIKINVEIGLTPRLEKALSRLFMMPEEKPAEVPTGVEMAKTADIAEVADIAEAPAAEEAPTAEETPAAEETPSEAPAEKKKEIPAPTDQELRSFMDMAIARFAGVDWQESKDPEVMKIRRSCTKCFKEIASHLGAEKPTMLQGVEKRLKFVAELDNMLIDKSTQIVSWYPF